MHLTQLEIEGFRSLNKVTWKPGALNVVIGPNGSGKSNLLRLLEMISAGANGKLGDYVQVNGGMSALVWDGQVNTIRYTVTMAEEALKMPEREIIFTPVLYGVLIKQLGNGANYQITQEAVNYDNRPNPLMIRTNQQVMVFDQGKQISANSEELPEHELALSASYAVYVSDHIPFEYAQYQEEWTVYHAINTSADTAIRQPAVTRRETQVVPNGQNLVNVLHTLYTTDREFKASINSAMQAAFGPDYDELVFIPASTNRIELQIRWKTLKREQSAADLSDGTLRFLFLITVLANPHPAPLIAIDEPETGLHPSMLPIIAEYAAEASQRTQIIFTTHSDQFLDAFGDTKPTTTVAKWEDGQTTLTTLTEDELAYWLKDYSLGKLFRTGELEALA